METINIDAIDESNINPDLEMILSGPDHIRYLCNKHLKGKLPNFYTAAEETRTELQQLIEGGLLTPGSTYVDELISGSNRYGVKFFFAEQEITFGVCQIRRTQTQIEDVMLTEPHLRAVITLENKVIPNFSIMRIAAIFQHGYALNQRL